MTRYKRQRMRDRRLSNSKPKEKGPDGQQANQEPRKSGSRLTRTNRIGFVKEKELPFQ